MLLVADVGNANTVLGVYQDDELVAECRIRSLRDRTRDETGVLCCDLLQLNGVAPAAIRRAAICSVVPAITDTLAAAMTRYLHAEPFVLGPGTDYGIAIDYNPPGAVGGDRLVNAVAAQARYGGPAVIVDLGTATTVDAIDGEGNFLGGMIAPGIGISTDALVSAAARLGRVAYVAPDTSIPNSTVEAIQGGVMYGFAGQVDALVSRVRMAIGGGARVIATGGFATTLRPVSAKIEIVDPTLTLEGIRLVWQRNHASASAQI